jgi:hypothetical protein
MPEFEYRVSKAASEADRISNPAWAMSAADVDEYFAYRPAKDFDWRVRRPWLFLDYFLRLAANAKAHGRSF